VQSFGPVVQHRHPSGSHELLLAWDDGILTVGNDLEFCGISKLIRGRRVIRCIPEADLDEGQLRGKLYTLALPSHSPHSWLLPLPIASEAESPFTNSASALAYCLIASATHPVSGSYQKKASIKGVLSAVFVDVGDMGIAPLRKFTHMRVRESDFGRPSYC